MIEKQKPVWREWLESLLVILVLAFAIRSFVIAPFKIPSSSMIPTLEIGDFIFVIRYPYGLRIPLTDLQFFPTEAERGDVAVFDFPEDRSKDYIKRIVGIAGDKITYKENRLFVNDQEMPLIKLGRRIYFKANDDADTSGWYEEDLLGVKHEVLRKSYSIKDGEWVVPEGQYLVLGDNRNNSRDSRFWGYVPQSYLVGKAVVVWWSWNSHLSEVRWNRLGKLLH